jgi:hypothetical protein
VKAARALVPLLLLLFAGAVGGGCCDETSRRYEIDAPDDSLAALVEACQAAKAGCADTTGANCKPQACADVCKSVMAIAGDQGQELKLCLVNPPTALGATLEVIVTFCS